MRLVRYLFYLWVQRDVEDFNQVEQPLMIDARQILNVRTIYWFPQKKVWVICFYVLFFFFVTYFSFKYVSKFSSRDILHSD